MSFLVPEPLQPLTDDPDDYRPNSRVGLLADPAGQVDMTLLVEECAVGDAVPVHRHETDEVIYVIEGADEVRIGNDVRTLGPGAVAFIPAGVAHSQRNAGEIVLKIAAVFPSPVLDVEMLGRNPAPGTESDLPLHSRLDTRRGEVTILGPSRPA